MENKFLTFINPYLSYIDKGHFFRKPFSWLYAIIAIINLLFPLYILYKLIFYYEIFNVGFKITITVFLAWAIMAFANWLIFQIWWDRKTKITFSSDDDSEFVVTPVFSHFIQTLGESIGTWVGLVGFGYALLTTILLGEQDSFLSLIVGRYLSSGWLYVFLMPIFGFLIIVSARFLAEQIKALFVIANNTKQSKPTHNSN